VFYNKLRKYEWRLNEFMELKLNYEFNLKDIENIVNKWDREQY